MFTEMKTALSVQFDAKYNQVFISFVIAVKKKSTGRWSCEYEKNLGMLWVQKVNENKQESRDNWTFKILWISEPEVTSAPEAVNSLVGHPILLACETKGFPVPYITWEFVGSGKELVTLPGNLI